jgi:hypothetical protein
MQQRRAARGRRRPRSSASRAARQVAALALAGPARGGAALPSAFIAWLPGASRRARTGRWRRSGRPARCERDRARFEAQLDVERRAGPDRREELDDREAAAPDRSPRPARVGRRRLHRLGERARRRAASAGRESGRRRPDGRRRRDPPRDLRCSCRSRLSAASAGGVRRRELGEPRRGELAVGSRGRRRREDPARQEAASTRRRRAARICSRETPGRRRRRPAR